MNGYKTPSLAILFAILGVLCGVAFLVVLGIAAAAAISARALLPAVPTLFLAGWAFVATVLFFGIGQVIDAICRSAYFAQRTSEMMERLSRNHEVTHQSIVHLMAAGHPPAHAAHAAPAEPRGYYYLQNGQVEGPHPEAVIRRLFNAGEITGETLSMRKGDKDWVPLGQLFPM